MAKGYNLEQTGPQVQEAINKSLNLTTATQSKEGLMSAQDKQKLDSLDSELAGKVDKVQGKGLSTNDYDNTEKGKVASAYQKPVDGIPASDLAEGVIPDTSQFITKTVNDLANYYLKTETYSRSETYTKSEVNALIALIKQFTYQVVSELPEASESTMYKLYLVPSADPQTQNVKDEYITVRSGSEGGYTYAWEQIGSTAIDLSGYVTTTALNTALSAYTTTADLTTILAAKQDVIADLSTIRSGAAAGATAYQKPSGGIPGSDIASGVIPSVPTISKDISADALSDSKTASPKAVKEYVDEMVDGEFIEAWDGSSEPVVANIPAGVSVEYNSTTYTGTLSASASTKGKVYLVSNGNGEYDRYKTSYDGTNYSWSPLGSTAMNLSGYATKEEVTQLQEELEGEVKDKEYTPTATAGYYFTNNSGNLGITSNGGSSHTGTVTSTSTPPTDGVDISAYVGKTLRIYNTGGTTTSQRDAVILNASNGVVASVKENAYTQDSDGYWVAEMLIPANGKMFYWSGVRTFVKVVILDAEQTTGLIERVSDLEEETGDIAQTVSDLAEEVGGYSDDIEEINKDLDGTTEDKDVTPSAQAGYYYTVSANRAINAVSSSGSYYTGTIPGAGSGIIPTNGVDVSAYIGKTLRVWTTGDSTTSTRPAFLMGADGLAIAGTDIGEKDYLQDTSDPTKWYCDIVIPAGSKYFFWSGVRTLSAVYILNIETPGIKQEVAELASDVQAIQGVLGLESASLKVVIAYPKATISEGENKVVVATDYQQARIADAGKTVYDSNPLFNFYEMKHNGVTIDSQFKDDIAPAHFLGDTLGANHGKPCKKATITGHGLTNTAIGTAWVQNDVNFYVMNILDADHIVFLSANKGTVYAPSWTALQAGTLTNGGNTLTVESVSDYQILPSIKNEELKIRIDGNEVSEDGEYYGNVVDFVESYEVMNPSSLLDNIIARAGQSSDPVFTGDGAVRIENIYRFVKGMSVLVISNFAPKQQMSFQDVMFSQAMLKGTNGQVKYYVPNSLPFGSYDLRQPLTMTWGNGVANMYCTSEYTKDTTKPINRVLQYGTGLGYAIGFLIDRGVGKSLFDYTHATFELRGGTGKVYPHGVDGATVGTTLQSGQVYGAVIYRCPFIPETSGNRLSMYHFRYEGSEYVFLDYKGTMNDRVVLDDSLNGKEITVLESQNATLLTDVYNGGFYVKATFVTNETCYLVAKIS